ncbi:hypothetical protein TrLO_g4140 [Triparma laevis f. longispina]|uniref:PH domain-containing protein n=1 Tax=Triparma laevis f. longispina TaxID=1714387 RepID=A0A9W7KXS8_9STRA|nr:hypothetical protein TrLO_g4140 [Triparma laevis f. longispina]
MSFFSGKPKRQNLDDNAAGLIAHFEHSYDARLVDYSPESICPAPEESSHEDNNVKLPKSGRVCELTLSGDNMSCSEHVGTRIGDMRERPVIKMDWVEMAEIAWDHQQSQVRFKANAPDGSDETHTVIFMVANSLEFEANIKLRLKGIGTRQRGAFRLPSTSYIGMFAGVTKPKPFQRKRASLTTDTNEQLPPLDEMRTIALESYRGSGKPMMTENSARRALAIEHIYDGKCTFHVQTASGPGLEGYHTDALLCLGENDVSYYSSEGQMFSNNKTLFMAYEEIDSWEVRDSTNAAENSFILTQKNSNLTFMFTLKENNWSTPTLLHLKHCMEFFWNQHLEHNDLPAQPHTTHGRAVARVFTLQGHKNPSPTPVGQLDIADSDGRVVVNFNERNRRASSVGREAMPVAGANTGGGVIGSGKFESIRRNTTKGSTKRNSFFGGNNKAPAVERAGVRDIWKYVVKHQGWLTKKGGLGPTGKKWLDRYFVLYSTAMGHYMSYYSEYGDSPFFSNERKERNLIDLGKVTFIRPVSNQQDAPAFSFDIVTIEREWTLCAQNENDMQLWLQLITTAVDEDVAIVPDDDLCFEVKTLKDPTDRLMKYDYSTMIKVSAWGVSVGTKNGKSEYHERFFWCYTDFYKWSVQNQFGKLTLFVSVFTNNDFSQSSKQDFEFRSRQAVQLASAIEFYIEKFMSIMYLRNEGLEVEGDYDEDEGLQYDDEAGYDDDVVGGEVQGSDDEPDSITQQIDLLDLGGGGEPPIALATAVPVGNDGFGLPDAGSANVGGVVQPPNPPATFDPFADGVGGEGGGGGPSPANDLLDAFTTPSIKAAPQNCIDNMNNNNVPQFLKGKNEGMLYSEPGVLNVMLKQEWRGSQGRLSICYVNAGQSPISDIAAEIKAEENNPGAVRMQLNALPNPTLAAGAQVVQQLMVECMQPFADFPIMTLTFAVGGAKCEYKLKLPAVMTHFMEATPMEGDDFMARWQKLSTPALQNQCVINSKTATLPAIVEQVMEQSGLKTIPRLAEKSGGICGVGTLRTGTVNASGGKISVGVLCRVEINVGAQAYRVTIRTAHGGVSQILGDHLKLRLGGGE